jgi:hypothetical protein
MFGEWTETDNCGVSIMRATKPRTTLKRLQTVNGPGTGYEALNLASYTNLMRKSTEESVKDQGVIGCVFLLGRHCPP